MSIDQPQDNGDDGRDAEDEGASSPAPSEGADDVPPEQPGSPKG